MRLTRRQFVALTAGAAAGAAIPEAVAKWVGQTALADSTTMYFLTDATRAATCAAACARIVPTGASAAADPGATEAEAVVFIDRFLAAFQPDLSAVADGPPVWLSGPFSGRNPYPDNTTGQPDLTSPPPPDSFYSNGQMHTLALTRTQKIVWYAQLYGASSLPLDDPVMGAWAKQVADETIPGLVATQGLRQLYDDGLDALDNWSLKVTGQHFANAPSQEQDLMLAAAGNVILSAVAPPITSNLPSSFPTVAPPAAAQALFPVLVTHTFQACYGLPEYRQLDSNPLWKLIGFDGDTQPLGNSIYGSALDGDNEGFGCYHTDDGLVAVYPIIGGYHEYRPVSFISDEDDSALSATQAQQMVQFLKKAQSR